ncbi:hypothetical protein U9M48_018967 [Paspalum notatum var. saurae]|uniref:Tf2-1-like SH3-like domain-containing protein n=1 Tax=Paspalum notatum var. saurae TaxID=547442 RepID=A0AAQ3TBP9_PASNO
MAPFEALYGRRCRTPLNWRMSHFRSRFSNTSRGAIKDLVDYGFMPGYETWTFHGEKETRVETEGVANDGSAGVDMMDEMLEALQLKFALNSKDPPTKKVEEFFKLFQASEEPLHEHTKMSVLAFVTRLIAIESKYFFSNKCFNDLVQLIGDAFSEPHKLPKDIYQCKRLTKSLGMGYEKIDTCKDCCMLFYDDHKDEKKCLICGKGRYVEVINEDGEKVTTDVAHKQLRSFPVTPRFKWLFLSKKTCEPMWYPKEGPRAKPGFMAHPADSDAWMVLDEFDPEFARDARNSRFGLATDGFTPFGQSAASYSCWPWKSYSDRRRRPLVFRKDDHVYLRVSPMKGVHCFGVKGKLAPRYVGPFKIIEQCGPVAYRLELPSHLAAVHDVFHVSQLKKCLRVPEKVVDTSQIQIEPDLAYEEKPIKILD